MTKTKARYTGEWDPEFTPGEVYLTFPIKDRSDGKLIAAENKHGETYAMPAELFQPIED